MKKKSWSGASVLYIAFFALILAISVFFNRGEDIAVDTLQERVRETLTKTWPSVVMIVGGDAVLGGGVFISENGWIMTSRHLVQRDERYGVRFADNEIAWARVVALHPALDLALLRLEEPQPVRPIRIYPSWALELGDFVLAFWVVPQSATFSSHFGILSGMDQTVRFGTSTITGLLLTDIPFQPGYSGSPLVNLRGELIGIHTAFGGERQLGWSTPVDEEMIRAWVAAVRP